MRHFVVTRSDSFSEYPVFSPTQICANDGYLWYFTITCIAIIGEQRKRLNLHTRKYFLFSTVLLRYYSVAGSRSSLSSCRTVISCFQETTSWHLLTTQSSRISFTYHWSWQCVIWPTVLNIMLFPSKMAVGTSVSRGDLFYRVILGFFIGLTDGRQSREQHEMCLLTLRLANCILVFSSNYGITVQGTRWISSQYRLYNFPCFAHERTDWDKICQNWTVPGALDYVTPILIWKKRQWMIWRLARLSGFVHWQLQHCCVVFLAEKSNVYTVKNVLFFVGGKLWKKTLWGKMLQQGWLRFLAKMDIHKITEHAR